MTLGEQLADHGMAAAGVLAIRISLHAQDRTDDIRSLQDLPLASAIAYGRMQNGRRFGDEVPALLFLAEAGLRARLAGYVLLKARRRGLAPGDIVYDPDLAPLLHNFIARCRHPMFYDALDLDGLEKLIGQLVIRWPSPALRNRRSADDPSIMVSQNGDTHYDA